jgi:hypothetical protein
VLLRSLVRLAVLLRRIVDILLDRHRKHRTAGLEFGPLQRLPPQRDEGAQACNGAARLRQVLKRSADLFARKHQRVLDQLLLAARKMMADRAPRRTGVADHLAHAGGVHTTPAHQVGGACHHLGAGI